MKTILIVEDNPDILDNLAELLSLSGYQILTAANGKKGVQLALQEVPDLILCDVMMPELDGFGVLRILEKNPISSHIPFIFLTAKADKQDIRRGMNLGADDYITKPFDDVELLDAIELRLRKSERVRQTFDGTQEGFFTMVCEARGQEVLDSLIENKEVRLLQKKDQLYRVDQVARYLYFVNSGQIKTHRTNEWGKELITGLYGPSTFLGYKELIRQQPYQENASAMETSEITLIPQEQFLDLMYNNRDLCAHFVKILSQRIIEKEEQLLSLAYDSIRKRVADALLFLHDQHQSDAIRIQREDLANLVGTAKESAIRTLTDFRQEGLIAIDHGEIQFLDLDRLRQLQG